ncbi:hypothetical protein [Aquifex pyrophilus]
MERREGELKYRSKELTNWEEELKRFAHFLEEEAREAIEKRYWSEKVKLLKVLEEKKKREIGETIRRVAKEVAQEQEKVYASLIDDCERTVRDLTSRIHNQREQIKALQRKVERLQNQVSSLKGQFGARVIDIVKNAERNWILKGLKARNDLKLIKEKLRKM